MKVNQVRILEESICRSQSSLRRSVRIAIRKAFSTTGSFQWFANN